MRTLPTHWHGVAYFIAAMACFSTMNVTIRSLSGTIPTEQMVFVRNIISLGLLLPFFAKQGFHTLKTSRPGKHLLRAMAGLLAMETWFICVTNMPVNTATAISFTAPLFATILAVIVLHERIGWRRIMALLIGFSGVLIIANPFTEDVWNGYTALAIFSTFVMAWSGIIVKQLTTTEPSIRIVFYLAFLLSIMSFPLAIPVWQPMTQDALVGMFIVAFVSTLAQFLLTQSFQHEAIVVLVPFEFTRLIMTALLAWMVLAEPIGAHTVIGSMVIVGSSVFIAHRKAETSESKEASI